MTETIETGAELDTYKFYGPDLPEEIYKVFPMIDWLDADDAEELLKRNNEPQPDTHGSNRASSTGLISNMADDMLSGSWRFSHQGIALNDRGELVDGAHRLKALIVANRRRPGIKVLMIVWHNIPGDAIDVIDLNRRRTPGDFLTMDGFRYGRTIAKAVKLVWLYRNCNFDERVNRSFWARERVSIATIREVSQELEVLLKSSASLASAMGKYLNPSASLAAMCILNEGFDAFKVAEFFHGVRYAASVSDGDARFALRNWAINTRDRSNRSTRVEAWETLAVTLKAFRKWREGKTVQALAFRIDEKFPRP